ncbi:MAG: helix-turn-helix domain-containing protein [Phycisphaeraceae bacterium]|nr:helix-turn-helix domain-containing protein [Phycisphaeraceae bacterium]MBX3405483.1 helix-turn-helix domain-containing protein [Phycisphaeraceae bacterium]
MPNISSAISVESLSWRRRALGMSHAVVAARSGVAEPTVKRILGGQMAAASFGTVVAIAEALGVSLGAIEVDPEELRRRQARRKAEQIARLVQGTSALEGQAVDPESFNRLVERSYHELLAGSNRRLWSE